jgi:hypothetical protein
LPSLEVKAAIRNDEGKLKATREWPKRVRERISF